MARHRRIEAHEVALELAESVVTRTASAYRRHPRNNPYGANLRFKRSFNCRIRLALGGFHGLSHKEAKETYSLPEAQYFRVAWGSRP
jgi:hypothetical protein